MEKNYDIDTNDEIIELIDEDGNSTMFEHIVTIEHEGETYIMVVEESEIEYAEQNNIDELDAVVLHVEQDEDGNDIYTGIEDIDLASTVFEKCLEVINSEDFEEEE